MIDSILTPQTAATVGAAYGALQLVAQAGMAISRIFTPRDTVFFKICKAIVSGFPRVR